MVKTLETQARNNRSGHPWSPAGSVIGPVLPNICKWSGKESGEREVANLAYDTKYIPGGKNTMLLLKKDLREVNDLAY